MALPNPGMSFTPFDILPASDLNDIVENVEAVGDGTALPQADSNSATVATSQSTTSTTFTDLATVGPSVTVDIGANGMALVCVEARLQQANGNNVARMSYAVSGANSASATNFISLQAYVGNAIGDLSGARLLTGLNAGSTTFTAKYACEVGGTSTFANRRITVIPL